MAPGLPSRLVLAGVVALVSGLHVLRVLHDPLVQYGYAGAELIEYAALERVYHGLPSGGWPARLGSLPDVFSRADGAYPPGLHLAAAAFQRWTGEGFTPVLLLNLAWLGLVAAGTASLARQLRRDADPGDSADLDEAGRLAWIAVLLTPAVYATARRYYYDLPMAAWTAAATAAAFQAHRSGRAATAAGFLAGLALLTKWQAALFLVFPAGLAAVRTLRSASPGLGVRLARLAVAVALPIALTAPLVLQSSHAVHALQEALAPFGADALLSPPHSGVGSFETALASDGSHLEAGHGTSAPTPWRRLGRYASDVMRSSLGLPLFLGLAPGWLLLARRPRVLVPVLACVLLPAAILAKRVGLADVRYVLPALPLVVAASAAGWSTAGPRVRAGALAVLTAAGLWELAVVEGLGPVTSDPRPPSEGRAWNRRGEAPPSPWLQYRRVLDEVCTVASHLPAGTRIAVEERLLDHEGWRWAAAHPCPGRDTAVTRVPDGLSTADTRKLLETAAPVVLLTPGQPTAPGWTRVASSAMVESAWPVVSTWVTGPGGGPGDAAERDPPPP